MDKCTATTLLSSLSLAALAALAGATPTRAADLAPLASPISVGHGDLKSTTLAGATTSDQRIRGPAHSVCGNGERTLIERHPWWVCRQGAMARARAP